MPAKHWPLIVSCWHRCPAQRRSPATCKHWSRTVLPPPSAATQYRRQQLPLPASLAETHSACPTSCTRRPAPQRHDERQLQSDIPAGPDVTKRWNQNNRTAHWQYGPGTTGSRGRPARGLGRWKACRGSLRFAAQRVSEGAYIGGSTWTDAEGAAARIARVVQAARAGDSGLLMRRPQESAVPQAVAWEQCAPPQMAARYEGVVDNQSIPFWSARIACRQAVSRRILSSAVCTESGVMLAHAQ